MNQLLKFLAKLTAYIFHPLFILFYSVSLLLLLRPHWFGVVVWSDQKLLMILVLIYSVIIPLICIALLRFSGLIKSFEMQDKFDRIAPLIVCLIFYLWLWYNLKQNINVPKFMQGMVLSSIISMSLAFAINNWIKLSLHTLSISVFVVFWIFFRLQENENLFFRLTRNSESGIHLHLLIGIGLIIAGWIGTSRLLLGAHTKEEINVGYFTGLVSGILGLTISLH